MTTKTTICIDYSVPADTLARIESLLADVAARDPNWNGANFVIERADYTGIPDADGYDAAALYRSIVDCIQGTED